jgi:PIN domain nuclease of toxin-antitoxin system
MGIEVLDACALIAFINDEPGASQVELLLNDPDSTCYVHSINLCEVYHQMIRASDETIAKQVINDLLSVGLIAREDMDGEFWRSVGEHKARGRISLADCFCFALAIRLDGQVVTSDHGEFDPLVSLGLCPILFIR